jgi:hypothetical protein
MQLGPPAAVRQAHRTATRTTPNTRTGTRERQRQPPRAAGGHAELGAPRGSSAASAASAPSAAASKWRRTSSATDPSWKPVPSFTHSLHTNSAAARRTSATSANRPCSATCSSPGSNTTPKLHSTPAPHPVHTPAPHPVHTQQKQQEQRHSTLFTGTRGEAVRGGGHGNLHNSECHAHAVARRKHPGARKRKVVGALAHGDGGPPGST